MFACAQTLNVLSGMHFHHHSPVETAGRFSLGVPPKNVVHTGAMEAASRTMLYVSGAGQRWSNTCLQRSRAVDLSVVNSRPTSRTHLEHLRKKAGTGMYVDVNGLRMYYQDEGRGRPLLLLHGGLSTVGTSFGELLPSLRKAARVITPEMQGHGHTADRGGPLDLDTMVDDMATLLSKLGLDRIDVAGYSLGGIVALGLAIRHPEMVSSLTLVGTPFSSNDLDPQVKDAITHSGIKDVPVSLRDAYLLDAPSPEHLEEFVAKVHHLLLSFGWSEEQLMRMIAPCLMIFGDHDIVPPERAVINYKKLRHGQLAILPAAGHDAIITRSASVFTLVQQFLAAQHSPLVASH